MNINAGAISGTLKRKKRLLIVDDSDFIRDRLVDLFDDIENFDPVSEAKNSEQAYTVFNSSSPDIVLLDIQIPGDNGIKILEKFKMLKPGVIIIMLTNYPYEQYRKRCMELGADYFFEKSGDMKRIYNICDNLILI
jgi:DNA-binding NarL/FixJ family response regulator